MTLPDRLRRMSSDASRLFSQWDADGRDNCGSLLIEAAEAIERQEAEIQALGNRCDAAESQLDKAREVILEKGNDRYDEGYKAGWTARDNEGGFRA